MIVILNTNITLNAIYYYSHTYRNSTHLSYRCLPYYLASIAYLTFPYDSYIEHKHYTKCYLLVFTYLLEFYPTHSYRCLHYYLALLVYLMFPYKNSTHIRHKHYIKGSSKMSIFSWVYKQYTFSDPLPSKCTDQHFLHYLYQSKKAIICIRLARTLSISN